MRKSVIFLLFSVLLFSCGSTPKDPEQAEYDSMCSSLKFKSYKTASENTIPLLLQVYNSTAHEDHELLISENILRLLIGYSWVASGKPEYAVAESKAVQDNTADDKDVAALSHALEAMALYEKNLDSLAGLESTKASECIAKSPEPKSNEMKKIAFHLLMGTYCIYIDNLQGARYHFAEYNIITEIEWPYLICDAMADIKEGKITEGLKKIKDVSENTTVPEEVKALLLKSLMTVGKDVKEVNPHIFWDTAVSQSLYSTIKDASVEGIDKITTLMGNIQEKLTIE